VHFTEVIDSSNNSGKVPDSGWVIAVQYSEDSGFSPTSCHWIHK